MASAHEESPRRLPRRAQPQSPHSINRRLISVAATETPDELLSHIGLLAPNMNLVNLATSWHRLARAFDCAELFRSTIDASEEHRKTLSTLTTRTNHALLARLPSSTGLSGRELRLTLKGVSNTAYALGVLKWSDQSLLETLVSWHEQHLQSLQPFELCSAIWSLARCSLANPRLEASANAFVRRGTQHAADLVLLKLGIRSVVMVVWACVVRQCHLNLVGGCFLPRIKTMLRSTELNETVAIELIEAYKQISTQVPGSPFSWVDITINIARSISLGNWSPASVVNVTRTLLRLDVGARELKRTCWQLFRNNDITKEMFLSVVQSCCLPVLPPFESLTLPHLLPLASESIMIMLPPSEFPWGMFTLEELVELVSIASARSELRLESTPRQSWNNRKSVQQARNFLRLAPRYIFDDLTDVSGVILVKLLAAYAQVRMAGRGSIQEPLTSETARRLETGSLEPFLLEPVLHIALGSCGQGYQALVKLVRREARTDREALWEELRRQQEFRTPDSSTWSGLGSDEECFKAARGTLTCNFNATRSTAAPCEESEEEDELEINCWGIKNGFVTFGFVDEADRRLHFKTALEITLKGSTWTNITEFRAQYEYFGLV